MISESEGFTFLGSLLRLETCREPVETCRDENESVRGEGANERMDRIRTFEETVTVESVRRVAVP